MENFVWVLRRGISLLRLFSLDFHYSQSEMFECLRERWKREMTRGKCEFFVENPDSFMEISLVSMALRLKMCWWLLYDNRQHVAEYGDYILWKLVVSGLRGMIWWTMNKLNLNFKLTDDAWSYDLTHRFKNFYMSINQFDETSILWISQNLHCRIVISTVKSIVISHVSVGYTTWK